MAVRRANLGARLEIERQARRWRDPMEDVQRRMERLESAVFTLSLAVDDLAVDDLAERLGTMS